MFQSPLQTARSSQVMDCLTILLTDCRSVTVDSHLVGSVRFLAECLGCPLHFPQCRQEETIMKRCNMLLIDRLSVELDVRPEVVS